MVTTIYEGSANKKSNIKAKTVGKILTIFAEKVDQESSLKNDKFGHAQVNK